MPASLTRIWALFCRYAYLMRRSLVRVFDIFFWPVMELFVWGFMTRYIQQQAVGAISQSIIFLIGALISWDIHYRGQLAMSIGAMEEIWTRNAINLLIAPIRLWEWLAANALHALVKVSVVTLVLAMMARWLYAFNIVSVGWAFLPLAAQLLLFAWALGLFTTGLLVRHGNAAEALIWGIPFLIQPFSCVFYPLATLPAWAQPVARCLPTTYIFEGLRAALKGGTIAPGTWATIAGLNVLYFACGMAFATWMLRQARVTGQLGRLGQE